MPRGKESVNYSVPGSKNKYSFDKAHTAKQTLAAFQEEQAGTGLSEDQLKEAWQLARGTKEPEDLKEGFVEGPVIEPVIETKETKPGSNKPSTKK
jgi:hypothetical protein